MLPQRHQDTKKTGVKDFCLPKDFKHRIQFFTNPLHGFLDKLRKLHP